MGLWNSKNMAVNTESKMLIEKTQKLTEKYVELLKEWVPKRLDTVKKIREIASDLQNMKQNVNISKVVGTTVGVLGGIAAVGGTILTGGLAAPLFIGGLAAAVAGTATSAGAGIAESVISKDKLKSAQELLDADKKLTLKIEDKKKELDVNVKELSTCLRLSKEDVLGAMFMSAMPGRGGVRMNGIIMFELFVSAGFFAMGQMTLKSGSVIGKGLGALAEVSLEGFSKVVGSVLKGVVAGAMVVVDIYFLVTYSIELANGSPSDAAKSLEEIASQLEKQANDCKTVLEEIGEKNEEYETILRKKFRKLLEKVASQSSASDEETRELITYIRCFASSDWRQAFRSLNGNENMYVVEIARAFRNFGRVIEEYIKNNEYRGHLNITLIAHGRINPLQLVPSQLYYQTDKLTSVTCYSPWGSAVDANVVYGIATNTIRIQNVQYSGPVRPAVPGSFNILPQSMDLAPNVIFSPVLHGEGAHLALLRLTGLLQDPANGLVIPYFTGIGNDLFPFPEIPLWVCANSVAICASLLDISVSLRIAACLSPENDGAIRSFLEPDGFVLNLTQYCQVPMNREPPVFMTNNFTFNQNLRAMLNSIDTNLFL